MAEQGAEQGLKELEQQVTRYKDENRAQHEEIQTDLQSLTNLVEGHIKEETAYRERLDPVVEGMHRLEVAAELAESMSKWTKMLTPIIVFLSIVTLIVHNLWDSFSLWLRHFFGK